MSDNIKLIYAGNNSNSRDESSVMKNFLLKNHQVLSKDPEIIEIINKFYTGKASDDSIVEILESANEESDSKKRKVIMEGCVHQDSVLGYVGDNEKITAIINKKGDIKYLGDTKSKLEALYEPFIGELYGGDPNAQNEEIEKKTKKRSMLRNASDKLDEHLRISLKKLKSSFGLKDAEKINYKFVIGQIVDSSKKYTKGLIMQSEKFGQKLILIKPIKVIKGVPVFAVLTTK